jgi:hypothetical protein
MSRVRINITVVPPFWQTMWFRVMLSVIIVAAVAGGFWLRTKTIQDRNRALERLVKERTHALEKRGREMEALYQADEKILRNVSLNWGLPDFVDVAVDMPMLTAVLSLPGMRKEQSGSVSVTALSPRR